MGWSDKATEETRILLIRHAETAEPGRFHGAESDVPLGVLGREQAAIVAREFARTHPDALFSSAMTRALETANPIGRACGLEVEVVPALHERRMGPLSGVPRAEGIAAYEDAKAHWASGDLSFTHEGGESYVDIRTRVVPPFLEIARRHAGQTVIVVAHGVVIRVLLTTLLERYSPRDFDRIGIANCGINDLRFDGSRWRAESLNRVPDGLESSERPSDGFRY